MRIPRGYKNPSGAVAFLTWVDPAVRDYVRVRAKQLGETVSAFVARLVRQEAATPATTNPQTDVAPEQLVEERCDHEWFDEDGGPYRCDGKKGHAKGWEKLGEAWRAMHHSGPADTAAKHEPPPPVHIPEPLIRLRSKEEREAIQAQREAENAKSREASRLKLEANRARTRAQVAKRKAAKAKDEPPKVPTYMPISFAVQK